jgi:AcrR family transcriptional regulator
MRVCNKDLTAAARIRNAALEGFARNGVAATSIRDVARAAGVSPGLVQHHYKTKADLEQAVNQHVVQIAAEAYQGFEESTANASTEELFEEIGDRLTEFFRDNRSALMHVVRSAAQGEEAGMGIFDAFMGIVNAQVERLAQGGALRDEVDRLWMSLHVVVFNLGTVMLEPAINRHLPKPLRESNQLERWNKATTDLMRRGTTKP